MISRRNARKYLRYIFDGQIFAPHLTEPPGQHAIEVAAQIRGHHRGPAVMIHGIMPRSGTVYVGELLRHHPDLHAYPGGIWELPFLERTTDLEMVQNEFLWSYVQNKDKIGRADFLPLFGASIIAYLHRMTPENKRMLLKIPGVQYLDRFLNVFPHEYLLLVVRDGRDVVHSTVRTWPQIRFWMACLRWRRAAEMTLYVNSMPRDQRPGFWLTRYEEAVVDPRSFITQACRHFDLDVDKYPWEVVDEIPVQGSSMTGDAGDVDWRPVEKSEDFTPVGHWRKWSRYRKSVFKRIAGDQLRKLGYGDEAEW